MTNANSDVIKIDYAPDRRGKRLSMMIASAMLMLRKTENREELLPRTSAMIVIGFFHCSDDFVHRNEDAIDR